MGWGVRGLDWVALGQIKHQMLDRLYRKSNVLEFAEGLGVESQVLL